MPQRPGYHYQSVCACLFVHTFPCAWVCLCVINGVTVEATHWIKS
jgi:hypothetical protein